MKELGNLAVTCAQRPEILFQVLNGKAAVYVGHGPEKTILSSDWDDDANINRIIHELNFGKYAA